MHALKIPTGWKTGQLLDFLELQRGVDLPVQNRVLGEFPILGSNGILARHNQFVAEGPGVVTGRSGTIGKLFYTEGKYWPLNTALYVKDYKGNLPKFVYYKLSEMGLAQFATGTGVPTLNRNVVHAKEVVFPPLAEQFRIAEILTTADMESNVLARLITSTKQLKNELMQTLFSQGVGFLSDDGRWVKHGKFKQTELGQIPACWDVVKVEDVAILNPTKKTQIDPSMKVSFLGMADLSEDGGIINRKKEIYENVSKGFTSFINDDILVAKITPCFENGKGALVGGLENGLGFGSTEFHVIRANTDLIDARFLYAHTRTGRFRKSGERNMVGSAGQKRVPSDYIRGVLIALPPLFEQQRIVDILNDIDIKIGLLKTKKNQCEHLKHGLMQKLLTGECRVKLDIPTEQQAA